MRETVVHCDFCDASFTPNDGVVVGNWSFGKHDICIACRNRAISASIDAGLIAPYCRECKGGSIITRRVPSGVYAMDSELEIEPCPKCSK